MRDFGAIYIRDIYYTRAMYISRFLSLFSLASHSLASASVLYWLTSKIDGPKNKPEKNARHEDREMIFFASVRLFVLVAKSDVPFTVNILSISNRSESMHP